LFQAKVSLPSTADGAIKVLEYKFPGAPKQPAAYPIELVPLVKTHYFETRPKMSLWGMLMGNPMMLMMGVMVVGMTIFPKLLGRKRGHKLFLLIRRGRIFFSPFMCACAVWRGTGEDAMKEFTDQQAKMQEDMGDASDPMAMFKKILSGEGLEEPKATAAAPALAAAAGTGAATKRPKKQRD
jgi:hypothetical protein